MLLFHSFIHDRKQAISPILREDGGKSHKRPTGAKYGTLKEVLND